MLQMWTAHGHNPHGRVAGTVMRRARATRAGRRETVRRAEQRSGTARWLTGSSALLAAGLLVAAACSGEGGTTVGVAEPTPTPAAAGAVAATSPATADGPMASCHDLTPTPAQTEGPYYKPGSPQRASLLEPGMTGTRLVITGLVVDSGCQPIAGAWLDFWQADAAGRYDNDGFRLRGHQYTDERGRFTLETVVPGLYPGRTRHLHVKVQAPGRPVLTTQLYLPDEPGNSRDGSFNPQLVLREVQRAEDGSLSATFTFVLAR